MQFCVENVSKTSGRIGQLIIGNETSLCFKTPLLLQTTKSGSIPHLSREVFDYVSPEPHVLQLTLSTMLRMAESVYQFNSKVEGGLSQYVGYKNFPNIMLLHDPCEALQSGHNDKDIVPIFTRHGKEQITAKRFMDLLESFEPNMYEGLCDTDTNNESSKKRIQKSFDRTENFMDYCAERQQSSERLKHCTLFAPVVGGYCPHTRTKSIKYANKILESSNGGYIYEGFHNYGLNAMDVNEDDLYSILTHCVKESLEGRPRMMAGAYTPIVLLELIRLGVDMFDTSYPYSATKYFKALTFNFDLRIPTSTKKFQAFLDLTDEGYKEDLTPFLDDCQCLACRKHTRAYVHHLHKTKELLGPILLMIHNVHHYMRFFEVIRESIMQDDLTDLIKLIKFQNTENEINYRVTVKEKISSKKKEDVVSDSVNVST